MSKEWGPVRVVGLDLSLTATGVVSMTRTGSGSLDVDAHLVKSKATGREVRPRVTRIGSIVREVMGAVTRGPKPALVVIESPAVNAKHGQPHERSGLWWAIVTELTARDILVVDVAPSQRESYAVSHLPKMLYVGADGVRLTASQASKVRKARVLEAVQADFYAIEEHNTADAATLAALGHRALGAAVDSTTPGRARIGGALRARLNDVVPF